MSGRDPTFVGAVHDNVTLPAPGTPFGRPGADGTTPAASAARATDGALNAPVIAGVAVSLVVGLGAIHLLTRVLRAAQFHRFAWYCWALGGVSLAMYLASR